MKTHKERFKEGEPFRMDFDTVEYDKITECILSDGNYYSSVTILEDSIIMSGTYLGHYITRELPFKNIVFRKEWKKAMEERRLAKIKAKHNRKGGNDEQD